MLSPALRGALVLLCVFLAGAPAGASPKVKVGADVLLDRRLDLVKGRRVGLVTNQSGRTGTGEFLVDALISRGVTLTALFGPEHGIRGEAGAGDTVKDAVDERTGLRVYSLYGAVRKPTPAMLKNVDVLLYDIQDVGARFYTYISTMGLCMEAAAEQGIEFVVLDRPDPLGGLLTEGPVLPDSLRSFVGMFPVPVVYGLTCGELATLVNEQGWLAHNVKARLTVIPMEGWTRSMRWRDTGLTWLPPSPNIRTPEAALIYPGTCLLEATNVSEGRGTDAPFRIIGAPFLRNNELGSTIAECGIKGLTCRDTSFTPVSSKFEGQLCHGAVIRIDDSDLFHPVMFGLTLLRVLHAHAPEYFTVNLRSLSRRLGDPEAYELIVKGTPASSVADRWRESLNRFRSVARAAWRYPEE